MNQRIGLGYWGAIASKRPWLKEQGEGRYRLEEAGIESQRGFARWRINDSDPIEPIDLICLAAGLIRCDVKGELLHCLPVALQN